MLSKEELENGFTIGDWDVLPRRRILVRGDHEEHPEPKVFDFLMALARRDGDIATRDDIVNEVWEGRFVADDPITQKATQLRKILGDQRPYAYVDTVVRVGYRLLKPVEIHVPRAREGQAVPGEQPATTPQPMRWPIVALLLVAAVIGYEIFMPDAPPNSIGVMPFANQTGDPGKDHLGVGFKEELIRTLRQRYPDLPIKGGHSSLAGESVPDIAAALDVEVVLTGILLSQDDEMLRITFSMVDGGKGLVRGTDSIVGDTNELFDLHQRLAAAVQDEVEMMIPELASADARRSAPASNESWNKYLAASVAFELRGETGHLAEAIALLEESVELDPDYAPAHLLLAFAYALLPDHSEAPRLPSSPARVTAANAAIRIDPSLSDPANAVFGFVLHKKKQWLDAEQAYRIATETEVAESNAFNLYSRMLSSVGRLEDALDKALIARDLNPTSAIINSRVALLYTWLDEPDNAERYFQQANRLGAGGSTHLLAYAIHLSRTGRLTQACELVESGLGSSGVATAWVDPTCEVMAGGVDTGAALAELDSAVAAGRMPSQIEAVIRVLLDDTDGALQVFRRLEQPGETFIMDVLYIPSVAPLRQRREADFLALLAGLGVQEYWASQGCEWIDDRVRCVEAVSHR